MPCDLATVDISATAVKHCELPEMQCIRQGCGCRIVAVLETTVQQLTGMWQKEP